VTVKNLLERLVDLNTLPTKSVLNLFSKYTDVQQDKDRLKFLSSGTPESDKEWGTYIDDPRRTILEVLEDIPSVKIPFARVLDVLPTMKARYFSISSSQKENPKQVAITVAVVKDDLPNGRTYDGVASFYLSQIHQDKHVNVFIHATNISFRVPDDDSKCIIMVGGGTGLAPYLGFLQERRVRSRNKPIGESYLYFGCRASDEDYIYKKELEEFVSQKVLTGLYVAFSRDKQSKKEYVQDKNASECTSDLE